MLFRSNPYRNQSNLGQAKPVQVDPLTEFVSSHLDTMMTGFVSKFDSFLGAALGKYQARSSQAIQFYESSIVSKKLLNKPTLQTILMTRLSKRQCKADRVVDVYMRKWRIRRLLRGWQRQSLIGMSRKSERNREDWTDCIVAKFEEKLATLQREKERTSNELKEEEEQLIRVRSKLKSFSKEFTKSSEGNTYKNSKVPTSRTREGQPISSEPSDERQEDDEVRIPQSREIDIGFDSYELSFREKQVDNHIDEPKEGLKESKKVRKSSNKIPVKPIDINRKKISLQQQKCTLPTRKLDK